MEITKTPVVLSAGSIMSDDVRNAEGENLGSIEELMIDVDTGIISYAVLSFGGFLGLGDKLFAIPWAMLTLDAEDHAFILNVDKDVLKNAPGFDKDNWPRTSDEEWLVKVYRYYNYEPYWSRS